jgi:hypothetical protein
MLPANPQEEYGKIKAEEKDRGASACKIIVILTP